MILFFAKTVVVVLGIVAALLAFAVFILAMFGHVPPRGSRYEYENPNPNPSDFV